MRRAVLASLWIGCSSPSSGIHGKLLVHTGDPTPWASVHVLLGDGSVYDVAVDGNGDALFEDRAIVGPQDVTVVSVSPTGPVQVQTGVAIDRQEIWLRTPTPTKVPRFGTITGQVLGASVPGDVKLTASGTTLFGSATAGANGTFTMDLSGTAGKFDLAAYEQDAQGNVLRAGLLPGLASAPMLVQNITLDHPLDQPRTVQVTGSDPYGPQVTYGVDVALDGYYLFGTGVTGPPPAATLSTVAPTGTFAGVEHTAGAYVSRAADPEPIAVAWAPLDGASVTLELLAPPIVQTPPLTGAPVALAAFDVTWTADPSVQYSVLNVQQNAGTSAELFWDITSPATVGEFVPFALPADASPLALKAGQCLVWLTTAFDSLLADYQDLYAAKPPFYYSPAATYRDAELIGVVQLQ